MSAVVQRQQYHILPRALSTTFPGSDKDKAFFQRYRDKVCVDLGGTFGFGFYSDLILRDCHNSPTIWHLTIAVAAIATSAIYKKSDVEWRDYNQFALQHVNKGLRTLRATLQGSAGDARLAVSACGLLCAFEILQGNYWNMRNQLISGRNVFDRWRASVGTIVGGVIVSPTIEFQFWEMFRRLELNFSMYAANNPIEDVSIAGDIDTMELEDVTFTTPGKCQWTAYFLLYPMSRWNRACGRYRRAKWPQPLPLSLIQEGEAHLRKLDTFCQCLATVMQGRKQTPLYLVYTAGFLLCRIGILTAHAIEETVHDEFLIQYQEVVEASRVVQEAESKSDHYGGTSLMDIELFLPLFYAGTRCRDPVVRRDVLTIMNNYPRRQSL